MAQTTFIQEGRQIEFTPTVAVAAGQVVVNGDLVGVALGPVAANTPGTFAVDGVFEFPKQSGVGTAMTLGALLYWDSANQRATATAAGNKLIGKAFSSPTVYSMTSTVSTICVPTASGQFSTSDHTWGVLP
jgi:predicted RecA/RadA family phage recombinase